MPRVSVLIPTYNRAETLPRAIDSALEQTVAESDLDFDLEVVVVDDGSTDETASVLASYEDPRVRPVVHATNQGANVARNTGIEHARGEFVAFLDSDDVWHPEKLERQLEVLDDRSDEWVGVYCDTTLDASGATGRFRTVVADILARTDDDEVPTREGDDELMAEILADNVQPGAGSTLLVRTDVARAVGGFDETLDRFQDPEFCLRIMSGGEGEEGGGKGKLAYVDEPLVVRDETGHPPADVVRRADEQYLATYEDAIERFEADGYDICSSHALVLAKRYFAEGRPLRGLWHLRTAAVSTRQYPGVCWAAGTGVRRRPAPFVFALVVLLVATVLGRYALHHRFLASLEA